MAKFTIAEMKYHLQTLIDSHNLASVLQALAYVCADKEQHLLENLDATSASLNWSKAALDLDRLARKQENRTGERQQYP